MAWEETLRSFDLFIGRRLTRLVGGSCIIGAAGFVFYGLMVVEATAKVFLWRIALGDAILGTILLCLSFVRVELIRRVASLLTFFTLIVWIILVSVLLFSLIGGKGPAV